MKYYRVEVSRENAAFDQIVRPYLGQRALSFPNGSAYHKEVITSPLGFGVSYDGIEYRGVGPGADFGMYFCNRDQEIARLDLIFRVPETPDELEELIAEHARCVRRASIAAPA